MYMQFDFESFLIETEKIVTTKLQTLISYYDDLPEPFKVGFTCDVRLDETSYDISVVYLYS